MSRWVCSSLACVASGKLDRPVLSRIYFVVVSTEDTDIISIPIYLLMLSIQGIQVLGIDDTRNYLMPVGINWKTMRNLMSLSSQ